MVDYLYIVWRLSLYSLEIVFILEIICILFGDYLYIAWKLSVYWLEIIYIGRRLSVYWLEIICILVGDYLYIG